MIKTIATIISLLLISCRLLFAQTTSDLEILKAKYESDKRDLKIVTAYVDALHEAKQAKMAEAVAREYMSRCPVVQLEDRDTYLLITPYLFENVYSNAFEYGISVVKKMCWERDEVANNSKQSQWERRLRAIQTGVSGDGEVDKRYEVLSLLSSNLEKEVNRFCDPVQKGDKYELSTYDEQKFTHLTKLVNKGEFLGKDGMALKLRVVEHLRQQQYSQAIRALCVGAELNLTGIQGIYLTGMMRYLLNCPLKNEELEEAIGTVLKLASWEMERGGGTNYYALLGELYKKYGDQEQAIKYSRLGEELEAERLKRYRKMMNL